MNSRFNFFVFPFVFACAVQFTIADQSKPRVVESPSGFSAKFMKLDGEGEGKTIISKDGKLVAEIADAFPLSFSPTADVLLIAEYAPDDDTRQYFLHIGEGEFKKTGSRLDYVFGGRYTESATWSADGQEITLHYGRVSAVEKETFKVSEVLHLSTLPTQKSRL